MLESFHIDSATGFDMRNCVHSTTTTSIQPPQHNSPMTMWHLWPLIQTKCDRHTEWECTNHCPTVRGPSFIASGGRRRIRNITMRQRFDDDVATSSANAYTRACVQIACISERRTERTCATTQRHSRRVSLMLLPLCAHRRTAGVRVACGERMN